MVWGLYMWSSSPAAGLVGAQWSPGCRSISSPRGSKARVWFLSTRVCDLPQADASHPGDRVGEVLVDDLLGDADGLKDLGGLVGLEGGDAHFGGDLHDAVEDGVVVVVHRRVEVLVQQALLDELREWSPGPDRG